MKRFQTTFVLALIIALLAVSFQSRPAESAALLYRITFINVGQGDAALLQDPNGFTVLIDGGKASAGPGLVAYLRSQGVTQIDVLLETHPDADHIGGLIDVLELTDIPVLSAVYNGYPGDTLTWADFAAAVTAEGLTLSTLTYPQTVTWGQMQVDVLNPESGLASPETNAACLAVKVTTGTVSTLFACDLDTAQESVILARPLDLNADILKVAHHGSDESSSAAFLAAVTPAVAVISVGDNSYGHPGAAALARLEDAGAGIWRTDLDGHVTVLTDGTTYTVNAPFVPGTETKLYLPLVVKASSFTPPPGQVVITSIFYDGAGTTEPDEYVEIQNQGGSPVELLGWTLRDAAEHVYTFPSFSIQAGQSCRVYTNQTDAATCGFSYNSSIAIWNNGGDCASLRDGAGAAVDDYCYGSP